MKIVIPTTLSVLTGVVSFLLIHRKVKIAGISLDIKEIIMVELVSAFLFSNALIFQFVPSIYYLLFKSKIGWSSEGFIWRFSTVIGSLTICVVSIGWINLLIKLNSSSNKN